MNKLPPYLLAWLHPRSQLSEAVAMHEWHSEVAEYRLRHDGVLPELELYVAGICREAVR